MSGETCMWHCRLTGHAVWSLSDLGAAHADNEKASTSVNLSADVPTAVHSVPSLVQEGTVCIGLSSGRSNARYASTARAEHASIVFEAARAADRQLGTKALRIIMARFVLGRTSALLRCCSQVP